jgi:O-antigen biosynthesis protein
MIAIDFMRKYGVRLCVKRSISLISLAMGRKGPAQSTMAFEHPSYKIRSIRGRSISEKVIRLPKSSLISGSDILNNELAKITGRSIDGTIFNDYLNTRSILVHCAQQYPEKFADQIILTPLYHTGELGLLFRAILQAIKIAAAQGQKEVITHFLDKLKTQVRAVFGEIGAHHFFSRLDLILGLRNVRIAVYDHSFHMAGGGQRYVAFMAESLQDKYEITYLSNFKGALDKYMEWYNIDLSRCKYKVIRIPFFEKFNWPFINEGIVTDEKINPFDVVSEESLKYDVFINANMLTKVQPLSPLSVFICHFPDQERERFFAVDHYDYIVTNSNYTSSWLKKKWNLTETHLVYPPVTMACEQSNPHIKDNIILSVARFEPGGSKKQKEMIKAFMKLASSNPEIHQKWKLVLAGGNAANNPYFKSLQRLAGKAPCTIEIKTNLSYNEIRELYNKASIFWHSCGLGEVEPHLVEHFGMTTVEAMQNYCVPIVIRGGGQIEIVEHGISGFTFTTLEELISYTKQVIVDQDLRMELAGIAFNRGNQFNGKVFKERTAELFLEIEQTLMGVDTV